MPRAKPTTVNVTADDGAIIARALHEAAWRHFNLNAYGFVQDAAVGRAMMEVIDRLFSGEGSALMDADNLREALSRGFEIPDGGTNHEAIRLFLINV